ncbi:MAG TPA: MerR family transcriptional regulator [Solirubrobacteraceae bacterium]|nr:MerR family transcriptional regulator [Solirubrobacteraceae bacterium]
MSVIRTNAAAAMLGVSPNTLRSWERRFSYPSPRRSEGGHRQFELAEIEALRQAFAETHNISSAISIARERGAGLGSLGGLREALEAFDHERCDRLLEESLAVRSVERTVQATLLPAVQSLRGEDAEPHNPSPSPEYCFAWRYASGWLAATQRVAPAATSEQGVVIFDASRPLDVDALYVQALELFLRRTGLRVLTLPVELQAARLSGALRALHPQAVVLGGAGASLDALGRLVYAVRQSRAGVQVLDYRGALPDTGASTVTRLGSQPQAAAQALREVCARCASAGSTGAADARDREEALPVASHRTR